ncbi:MAG: thioredoxin fold domain-containing protein [Candidatus Thiodiazotropha sp. (ex Dulcina madagascariensis)]|nr:thioredoxin fold domain-containing protein [Candidatus Thiodiazotropha sp. (ex Dulcina madagascariensis)]MCU7926500.1 thioredoxin fold domain-containing protein [Candidatus Thiodiazotropha sp. (ex Dulcina madagascariensis)]
MIKQYLVFVLLLFVGLSHAEPPLPTTDWSDTSAIARKSHSPILVVFGAEACGYCVRLMEEVIEPLSLQSDRKLPLIREFDIYSSGKITDFNGDPIRSRQFKSRYQVYAIPTLFILDADGKPLTDPIVGYNSRDEYRELLRSSLGASFAALE